MPEPYGYELVMDVHRCDPTNFTKSKVQDYCVNLCDNILHMKREDFHFWASDLADYEKEPAHIYGVTAVQFITTSSLVIHTLPKLLKAYVNIFSCAKYDPIAVHKFTTEWFDGQIVNYSYLERQ